jgi:hypothetical protein
VNRNKSQLQLRREFCGGIARAIFGGRQFAVISVVRRSPLTADSTSDAAVTMQTITWEDLATWSDHPHAPEFRRYYEWKQRWSKQ